MIWYDIQHKFGLNTGMLRCNSRVFEFLTSVELKGSEVWQQQKSIPIFVSATVLSPGMQFDKHSSGFWNVYNGVVS